MVNLCFSQGLLQQNLGGSPKTTRSRVATPAAGTPAVDPPAGEPRPDSEAPAGVVKIGSKDVVFQKPGVFVLQIFQKRLVFPLKPESPKLRIRKSHGFLLRFSLQPIHALNVGL